MHTTLAQWRTKICSDEALVDYGRAIELDPSHKSAYLNRGGIYFQLERDHEALADLAYAIRLAPENALSYANRAGLYKKLRRYNEALVDYSRAIELYSRETSLKSHRKFHPQHYGDLTMPISQESFWAQAYDGRASIYGEQLGRYSESVTDYTRAIELDPTNLKYYINRGASWWYLQQHQNALADFTRAIELDPHFAEAYAKRAGVYYELRWHEEALADWNHAIQLDPSNSLYYPVRAQTYKKLQRYDEALADYSRAIQLDPSDAASYHSRGVIYSEQKRYQEALADYSCAIQLDPIAITYRNRAQIYRDLERYNEAFADHNRAIQLNPADAQAYNIRGTTYFALQRDDEARADFERAIQLDPTYSLPYLNIGQILMRRGALQDALSYFDYAAQLGNQVAPYFAERVRQQLTTAFSAFQQTRSPDQMRRAVAQFPAMMHPNFRMLLTEVIAPSIALEEQRDFKIRLRWFDQIVNEQRSETAVCDVCGTSIQHPGGYMLTTIHIVSSPEYWKKLYEGMKGNLASFGVFSYQAFCQHDRLRAAYIEQKAHDTTPWVVCDACISMFDVDREQRRYYAQMWWQSGGTYTPPDAGPAPLWAINLGV